MSWTNRKGFNFRDTVGYVTDGTNETHVKDSTAYPASKTVDGDTFNIGWESGSPPYGPSLAADENSGVDARLAGAVVVDGNTPHWFRVNLPAAGSYAVRLALGGMSETGNMGALVKDTTTTLLTVSSTATTSGQFLDAAGTKHTSAANWASSNAEAILTFTTTICRVELGVNTSNQAIAHFAIRRIGSGLSQASNRGGF